MKRLLLNSLQEGEKGAISYIAGGKGVSKRLYEMGLNKGSNVEVVKNDIGPIIISLGDSRIAIGRDLAQKIIVNQ